MTAPNVAEGIEHLLVVEEEAGLRVRILDLGLAGEPGYLGGAFRGNLLTGSPEALLGEAIDHRADLRDLIRYLSELKGKKVE